MGKVVVPRVTVVNKYNRRDAMYSKAFEQQAIPDVEPLIYSLASW